jgi:hypothetical protein
MLLFGDREEASNSLLLRFLGVNIVGSSGFEACFTCVRHDTTRHDDVVRWFLFVRMNEWIDE